MKGIGMCFGEAQLDLMAGAIERLRANDPDTDKEIKKDEESDTGRD